MARSYKAVVGGEIQKTFGWSIPGSPYALASNDEGVEATYDLTQYATLPAGITPVWRVVASPAGVTIDQSGLLTKADSVPPYALYTVIIALSQDFDGYAETQRAFTFKVNSAPVWADAPATLSVLFGAVQNFAQFVSDPEDDALTFTLVGASNGYSITTAGMLTVGTASQSVTIRATDTGGLSSDWICAVTVTSANQSLPVYDLYAAFVVAQGGSMTNIDDTNERHWGAPAYPSGGTPVAIGATIAASGTYYLANGAHTGSITITASDVVLYAQTKHGATITGNITVNGNRCDVMGIKWAGTSTASPYCVDLVGSDNRVAYCLVPADFAPFDDSLRRHLFVCDGARSRVCYNTAISWRGGGHFAHISPDVKLYCRVDHNYISEWYCVDPTAPDNEFVQVGQAQYGTDYFALIDNNYLYRWNNNGNALPVAGADAETFTIKSDGNCIIANVFQGCHGTVNLREAGNCLVFGNYWFGDGMATAGGVGIYGQNHIIACNYFSDLNSGGSNNYAAFRVGNGDNLSTGYYAALNVEISFNTTFNCRKPIVFSPLAGFGIAPTGTKFFNNAIDINTASTAITVANVADIGTTWAGNVIEPTVGRAATGITAALPGLTLGNGVRYATPAGNCDGVAQPGYSAIIDYDAIGAPIGSDLGALQSLPGVNPWQAIIDGAGA